MNLLMGKKKVFIFFLNSCEQDFKYIFGSLFFNIIIIIRDNFFVLNVKIYVDVVRVDINFKSIFVYCFILV